MNRRVRPSPLLRAIERATTAMTRRAIRAGANAAGKAAARGVEAMSAPYRLPASTGDWITGQAIGPGGLRRFRLFRPAGVRSSERLPLLVMLHGCGQNAAAFARSTRMDRLASRERFLVLYPEQDLAANPQGCWNWYDTRSHRAEAEAATLIAAIDQACLLYPVDRGAVAVAGLSAGASMAALLAVRWPERFCAVAMHAGVAPGAARSAAGALAAMRGRSLPETAVERGNRPPLLVIHGSDDRVVSVRNAHAAAEQWAAALGARAAVPRRVQRGARHPMTVSDWRAQRRVCVRLCEVERLGHAWSGGVADEHFSDPKGPDASTLIWRFVQASLGGVGNEA
ncbi:MAG: PHB depolymerase family esterase [Thauera sp.]|jgi:poly(hydroxyalkanoate) depolymerase family esterase